MKRLLFITTLLCLFILPLAAETVHLGSGSNSVELLSSSETETVVQFRINRFDKNAELIDGIEWYHINLPKEGITLDEGFPQLPVFNRSIIIGNNSLMNLEIFDLEYQEMILPVIPSKGNLLREVNPADVPYTFNNVYQRDEFYPKEIVILSEPYIMRDFRGITIKTIPFQYNPATQTLRVYTSFKVRIYQDGVDTVNILSTQGTEISREFLPLYENHFLNWENYRYTPISDSFGLLLIIYHDAFQTAITPYFSWKRQKGVPTVFVPFSSVGTTATQLQTYIQNYYNSNPTLTFVQLVGDHAQIPTLLLSGYGGDPMFSLVAGGDNYPDIFIGRFSAENATELTTQVNKVLTYERDLLSSATWPRKAAGIASDEGPGDNGEYDWQHLNNIRTDLLTYGYTVVDQIYDPGATAADVTTAINNGRGFVNYTGHGSTTNWTTTGFSNTNVNNLTNNIMTPFIVSVACNNGHFTGTTCFAEAWLRKSGGGAIAFYGSSISQPWNPPMRAQDEVTDLLVAESKTTTGGLFFNGSCKMLDVYGADAVNTFKTWNLFGDASMLVRTKIPSTMTVTHPSIIDVGTTSVYVTTGVSGALVAITRNNIIHGRGYTNASGNVTINLASTPTTPCEYKITVTAFNKVTYVATIYQGFIWTGNTSTSWTVGSNWNTGTIPTSSYDVLIPAGCVRYPVTSSAVVAASCKNLTIENGANVTVGSYNLNVSNKATIYGQLNMITNTGDFVVGGQIIWGSGSTANITDANAEIFCGSHMTFQTGSNVQFAYGYIDFNGNDTSFLYNYSANTQLNNIRANVSAPNAFIIHSASTYDIKINGSFWNYTGKNSYNWYTGNVIIKGNLTNFDTGSYGLKWYYGTLVMDGVNQTINLANSADYLNSLTASQTGNLTLSSNLTLNNNMTIESGVFVAGGYTIYVGGNWNNLVGPDAFNEGTSRVIFNSDGHQYCNYTENFNILEVNKSGGALRVNSSSAVVTCASYDWTAGAVDLLAGTFNANSLADNGIAGAWYINSGCTINLTHTGWVDLKGDLFIFGGNFNVYGGSTASYWPYGGNASITMSNGTLNFVDQGVYITTSASYTFTSNITGGIIQVARNFLVNRSDFNPNGGRVTLTGSIDANVSHLAGSSFYNLEINKFSTRDASDSRVVYETDREGRSREVYRTNVVTATSDLVINGYFWVHAGVFNAPAIINVRRDWWNYVGVDGFNEGTGLVIFDGSTNSSCYGETFNNLELNKTGTGQLIIPNTYNVSCNSYDWTSGILTNNGGTFTALDLVDSAILGTINLNAGIINFHQGSDQYLDLRGTLNIVDGELHLFGGWGDSYWPWGGNAALNMSGGIINVHDNGIYVSSVNTFTTNITSGIIKTSKGFTCNRSDFTPTGGTLEMYSSNDAYLYQYAGTLHHIVINKSTTRDSEDFDDLVHYHRDREGILREETRSNTIILGSNLTSTGNLTIQNGTLGLGSYEANIGGTVEIFGNLLMNTATDKIVSGTNFLWRNGSNAQITQGTLECNSSWYVYNGANVVIPTPVPLYLLSVYARSIYHASTGTQLGNLIVGSSSPGVAYTYLSSSTEPLNIAGDLIITVGNELDMADRNLNVAGNVILNGKLDIHSGMVEVQGKPTFPATGNLSINTGSFSYYDSSVPRQIYIYGTLNINTGTFHADQNALIFTSSAVTTLTGGNINCTGINAIYAGTFQPAYGTVKINYSISGGYYNLFIQSGNWLPNLIIDREATGVLLGDNLLVKGNLTIQSGILDVTESNYTINITGSWNNQVGPNAFNEREGTVIFDGTGTQFCVNNENFHTLQLNKPAGVLRINNPAVTLTCAHYQWTSGGIEVLSGTFTANDLVNNGLFGSYTCDTGGTINLSNYDSYVDLNCNMTITGGEVNVFGGTDYSYWPYYANASLTMSGTGILDFKDQAIYIYNSPTYSFTHNITGGIIKTASHLGCNSIDFNPTAGTFEMTGSVDAYAQFNPGSSLYNLTINKSTVRSETDLSLMSQSRAIRRDSSLDLFPELLETRSNMAIMGSNLTIHGNLHIDAGKLSTNTNDLDCLGSININNNATMTVLSGSVVRIGNGQFFNVNNNGRLEVFGATMGSISGYYFFNVETGGTIAADNGIFEYMSADGLNIKNGSLIDPDYPFSNCTFRNGIAGSTLLTINNAQEITIENAEFPTNTWSGANNVKKTLDQGIVTFHESTGDFKGATYENDPFNRIFWTSLSDIDLQILSAVWSDSSPYAGDISILTVTVINNSSIDIPHFVWLDLYYDLDSPPVPFMYGDEVILINSLPPGLPTSFDFEVANFEIEEWDSWVQIDADQYITETDETNNVYGPLPINWFGLPEIISLSIEYLPTTNQIHLQWNYPIWVTTFNIYRSTNPYFTPGPENKVPRPDDINPEYLEPVIGQRFFYRIMAERRPTLRQAELPVRNRRE